MYPTTFFIHDGMIFRKSSPRSAVHVPLAEAQAMLDSNQLNPDAMESLRKALASSTNGEEV